jgi:hypothetical protein
MATRGKVELGKRTVKVITIPQNTKRIMTVKVVGDKKLNVKPVEKNFFEDFTTLRWVKWTTRQPDWNGSVYVRWNGKYTSNGTVWDGYLIKLDGNVTNSKGRVLKNGKYKLTYSANQKRLMEDMYWLEEVHDHEGYRKYEAELQKAFLNKNDK